MKLMPIKQAQAKLLNALADPRLKSLTLSTFKKDRSITLAHEGDLWVMAERGFQNSDHSITPGPSGKRAVKDAFKREFPHSTRAYVSESRIS